MVWPSFAGGTKAICRRTAVGPGPTSTTPAGRAWTSCSRKRTGPSAPSTGSTRPSFPASSRWRTTSSRRRSSCFPDRPAPWGRSPRPPSRASVSAARDARPDVSVSHGRAHDRTPRSQGGKFGSARHAAGRCGNLPPYPRPSPPPSTSARSCARLGGLLRARRRPRAEIAAPSREACSPRQAVSALAAGLVAELGHGVPVSKRGARRDVNPSTCCGTRRRGLAAFRAALRRASTPVRRGPAT